MFQQTTYGNSGVSFSFNELGQQEENVDCVYHMWLVFTCRLPEWPPSRLTDRALLLFPPRVLGRCLTLHSRWEHLKMKVLYFTLLVPTRWAVTLIINSLSQVQYNVWLNKFIFDCRDISKTVLKNTVVKKICFSDYYFLFKPKKRNWYCNLFWKTTMLLGAESFLNDNKTTNFL